jgi:predicted ATPase/class 3 adenylate cyclase/DNA-binding CsgD family transcriptional regulator
MRELPIGTVTLLFTDIEGSTRLLQQLGDRYANVLAECRYLLRATFQEWNGHEVDIQGDAFFVAFARATDAVLAAVEVQRALAAHPWPGGVAVGVRIGLHTGEPSLTSEGYVGLDVHRAARIMSAGHGGQVLLSQTTANLVEQELPADVTLRDLEEHRLKDLGRPRRLYQLVISDLPADFPPLKTLDTSPNNLPVQFTPFIGREQELTSVQQLLLREDVRLVTLTGPGGTGKTRLGLQVSAELSGSFGDGVFFVNLAPLSDPALVLSTIAQTLGIREVAGQSLLERLSEELQPKQVLLLLDNFEQVVSAALVVADLLAACPQLKVLVTSRMVLHVRAEYEFAVPPLALPDPTHLRDLVALSQYEAVALFLQRAQAVKPDFHMTTANARAVAEICIRLDGLPLAIELAAARIKLLPPPALLARLAHRLQVLTSGARDVPVRQQTLRNTIAWSYHLLDAQEQRLFRQLSVFVGGCTLEAIEAIHTALSGETDAGLVLDGVGSLIDKSLLQQREMQVGKEHEPRLLLLETIREYGLEALATSGELEAARQAHALYYLALAEQAEPHLKGSEQGRWYARLEQEQGNLRATLAWLLEAACKGQGSEEGKQQAERALRLCVALYWFWNNCGHWREGWTALSQGLTVSQGVAASVRARALCAAAELIWELGDLDRAQALTEEGLALFQTLGDAAGMGHALETLAAVAWVRSQYAMARSQLEEAKALFQEVGDTWRRGRCLTQLAQVLTAQGEYVRARTLLEESRELYKGLGDQHRVGIVLYLLARVLFLSGSDLAEAQALAEQSLALLPEVITRSWQPDVLSLLGQMRLQQGEQALARELFEASVATAKEMSGDRWVTAEALIGLARVVASQGEVEAARALYQESLTHLREIDNKESIPACLEGLADIAAAQGEPAWAARLWGAAEALRETIGTPLPPIERDTYERSIAATRTQLGEKAFAATWSEGRTMTPEQALAAQGPATMPSPLPAEPPSTPPAKPAPTYPDGLTAREVEVLRLLAQGLTDAQIAEQLVISHRTVNNHLTSIYSRIQVSSRSAATRYAIEHHLV